MTPQEEAKQYANARFFESDRANGEAWVISYTAYLDALTSEKLRSSKLLEALKAILSETNKVKEGYFCSITDDLFSIATSVLAAYES